MAANVNMNKSYYYRNSGDSRVNTKLGTTPKD